MKNFNSVNKQIELKLIKEGNTLAESGPITVLPDSVETFLFDDTPTGLSQIELFPKDDLAVDNTAYISAPLKKKVNVLLITNEVRSNLENALRASKDLSVNVVNPPVLTLNTQGNRIEPFAHDAIIIHNINNVGARTGILPGTYQDISNFVKGGGVFIQTAQSDLLAFDVADTSPVNWGTLESQNKKVCVDIVNEITKEFQNNVCFATAAQYFTATPKQNAQVLARIGDQPTFVVAPLGRGTVFYYGILDEQSDFRSLPSYPIFWNTLINFLTEAEDITDFNTNTGRTLAVNEQRVTTPSGTLTTSKLFFDEAGLYEFGGKTVAANVLDSEESDVTKGSVLEDDSESTQALRAHTLEENFSVSAGILLLVFLLLLFELWYIKQRGDF